MNDQKLENLLNLALDATDAEREKSLNMNFGYDRQNRIWELIVRYHGHLSRVRERTKEIILLSGGYAIITAEESEIDWISSQPEVEYIEKPKRLFFSAARFKISFETCFNVVVSIPNLYCALKRPIDISLNPFFLVSLIMYSAKFSNFFKVFERFVTMLNN